MHGEIQAFFNDAEANDLILFGYARDKLIRQQIICQDVLVIFDALKQDSEIADIAV